MARSLEHLRVLDLTRLLPGGYCTLLLADLGADVIKVEEPGKGDYIRWTPPFAGDVSAGLLALNRGKRSITLNLKRPPAVEVFRRLARDADVVVESFRPGVMDRLGVGWVELSAANPRLVYCAITGYGQDGPYRERAGHDINYLGYAGVLGLTGEEGGPPVVPAVQVADIGGGALMAAVGVLAALSSRDRTGRGSFVDISMMDGALSWLSVHAQAFAVDGHIPARGTMRLSGGLACYAVYRCGDGRFLTVGALEPQFWSELCSRLGASELIERQFADAEEQALMRKRLGEIFSTRTRDEWCAELAALDTCVGPVNDLAEAFEDPQARAREMIAELPVGAQRVRVLGNPVRMGDQQAEPRPAPGFGEHTDEVLRAAGYSAEEIASLGSEGAI
jgi:crotonobetainyl-CoA:carnitine CoA-transferase CaiB-like acyl-CoA transferase